MSVQLQKAQAFQRFAEVVELLLTPERQELQQVGAAHMKPGHTVALRRWLVLVKTANLLNQNRFFESDGGRQIRREL